ncbi:MAG: DUF3391 domain-containing protein [Nitrospiraceae bacterium]|nr:DUF3391 domain-containing protein [Nitrospiraceae bacterium]
MDHVKTVTIDQLKPGMFIVEMDQPWYRTPFLLHKRLIRDTKDIDLLRQCGIRELKIDPRRGLDVAPTRSRGTPPPPASQEQPAAIPQPDDAGLPTPSRNSPHLTAGMEMRPPRPQPAGVQQQLAPKGQEDTVTPRTSQATLPPLPEKSLQPASDKEMSTAQPQPPDSQQGPPRPPNTEETAVASQSGEAAQAVSSDKPPQPADSRDLSTTLKTQEQATAAQETYNEAIGSMERMFEGLEAGIVPRPDTLRTVVGNVLSRVLDNPSSMLSLLTLQKMKRFDRTLASHALDVCTLSLIVAHNYGVTEEDLDALGAGALLHDIGYTRLPRNLYRRSHDLTEQERATMRQHPALGEAVLREAKEDRDAVIRIVVEHHEYSNGGGFPHNLKGDSTSILAQLVGLVDLYDGMISRRGGRPAMLQHDAIRQLFRLGDSGQYPKDLIQSMIGSLGVYPIGSLVLMNTGEQAVVVGMNPLQRLKPVVKVIMGPQGGSYLTPIRVDLGAQAAGTQARTITKVLDPQLERVNVAMFLDGIHEEAA